jgi:large subunit ribosomal protein L22
MEVRAIAKYTGIPASKVRPLVNMVRGKKVDEALAVLRFMPTPKAKVVAKLVRSAAANAENNFQMDPADLRIVSIFANEAPSMRRYRPRARGRVSPIRRHSSHITVIVAEEG